MNGTRKTRPGSAVRLNRPSRSITAAVACGMICTALTSETTTSSTSNTTTTSSTVPSRPPRPPPVLAHGLSPAATTTAVAPEMSMTVTRRPGLDHVVPVDRPRRPQLAADLDPAAVLVDPGHHDRRARRPAPRWCMTEWSMPRSSRLPQRRAHREQQQHRHDGEHHAHRRRGPPTNSDTPAAASAPPPSMSSTNSPDSTSAAISTSPTMSQITAAVMPQILPDRRTVGDRDRDHVGHEVDELLDRADQRRLQVAVAAHRARAPGARRRPARPSPAPRTPRSSSRCPAAPAATPGCPTTDGFTACQTST